MSSSHDSEFKLPKKSSLAVVLLANALLQISFFVVVSSSNEYSHHLGGTSTFSGVVIGIPAVFSGLTLIPLIKYDQGGYSIPLHLCCATNMLGLVLYAMAYKTNFLYLILIGRIFTGIGFSMCMYCKRYCSDPRLVGIRRRMTLASWLITGNGIGMCLGPFLGGVFYRIGFKNQGNHVGDLWNGFTSPAWVLAAVWAVYWIGVGTWFEDIPKVLKGVQQQPEGFLGLPLYSQDVEVPPKSVQQQPKGFLGLPLYSQGNSDVQVSPKGVQPQSEKGIYDWEFDALSLYYAGSNTAVEIRLAGASESERCSPTSLPQDSSRITLPLYGVMFCMCWFAMTCSFVLGAWESNIPIFASKTPSLDFSPFASGNFLSLGALSCFPFFILNIFFARRVQDRCILVFGAGLGSLALITFLILVTVLPKPYNVDEVAFVGGYGGAFMCWFAVALSFNLLNMVPISLLSKRLPPTPEWNGRASLAIQYSSYLGRVTGAIWGGSGVDVGMPVYVGVEIAVVGIGGVMSMLLWKNLKAKAG